MKVLAIEDDPSICLITRRMLETAKVGVSDFRCINTLEAGLSEIAAFKPDVILLDLKLPRIGGGFWEAEETLSLVPEIAETAPVIILSGSADQWFVKAIELGAADCLDKKLYVNPRHEAFLAHQIALAIAIAHRNKVHAAAIH